ncbi:MAG TPA: hypothetical protein P5175_06570 [Anaerohalosphaeraceae bacterium]|nr:hypothetical protein [Anaerohalosphaeraceae bacterium]
MLSRSDILKMESIACGTPFYVVSRQQFESNFKDLTAAFSSRYQPFILAYSYKTNYLPYLCSIAEEKGGWAEVVSRLEYDLAVKIGHDPQKIIFNGPVKTAEDIVQAVEKGSIVNADSPSELQLITDYAKADPRRPVRVGLRINIALSDAAGQSHIQNALKTGRFGLDPAEFKSKLNIQDLKQLPNLQIVSLHGHTSTADRSRWCFEVITETLCRLAEEFFPDSVEYLNIGGGFFGRMRPDMPFTDVPGFDDYAETICSVLGRNSWVRKKTPALVIEPGVAMAADAVRFITKVVSVKSIRGDLFITVDGSAFHIKPTFHALNLPHQVITRNADPPIHTYSVVGATCMEKDILLRNITASLPEPGDYICIDNVGAYTLVLTPPFITPAPAVLADEDGCFKLVRRRQTLDDIFSSYVF